MRNALYLSTIALTGALTVSAGTVFAQTRIDDDLSVSAALHENDPTDREGHHVRRRSVTLRAGEGVDMAATSSEFDTVLRVDGPSGFEMENDDAQGEGTDSRIQFRAPRAGTYRITVRTYRPGETGEYHLSVMRGVDLTDTATPDRNAAPAESDEVSEDGSDESNSDESNSDESDSDDASPFAAPGCTNGICAIPAPSASATGQPPRWVWDPGSGSFVPADTDRGSDDEASADGATAAPSQRGAAGGGTMYGVFVGVSDYGGSNDLAYTAADARNLAANFQRSGVIRPGNAVVLTDGSATADNVRQAFRTLAPRVTERDTFVFFFDGHGNSGTISLRSGSMNRGQLDAMLNTVRGEQLVVLDSCHSGSFASIVRGRPNRVGLFSSRAEETSYVASEVQSGGWLAYYMLQASRGRLDAGSDGALQVGELTAYVQRGYAQRVNGQQHLVVATGANSAREATLWQLTPRNQDVAAR